MNRFLSLFLCLGLGASLFSSCTTNRLGLPGTDFAIPVPALPIPGLPLLGRGEGDFRHLSWSKSFVAMHERMRREYPFSEHKAVDWDALYTLVEPKILEAETEKNEKKYYLALREYLYSIPDGHIDISDEEPFVSEEIGGGYGLAATELNDGRVVVYWIQPGGPAEATGIEPGAEIKTWNGLPIQQALADWPVLWCDNPPATPEARRQGQIRMLFRAPIDTALELGINNPDSDTTWMTQLAAVEDEYASMSADMATERDLESLGSPVEHRMLEDNVAYLRLYVLSPTMQTPFFDRAVESALNRLLEEDPQALILDLRDNDGGESAYAAQVAAHFFEAPAFFEDVSYFQANSGTFEIEEDEALRIQPRTPKFSARVLVLVDRNTHGAAEGLAHVLSRLPNVAVMGYESTSGSYAVPGGGITMPRNYTVLYPVGRSLDEAGSIQLESDASGNGGVKPDVLVPFTAEDARKRFVQKQDPLLQTAIEYLKSTPAP